VSLDEVGDNANISCTTMLLRPPYAGQRSVMRKIIKRLLENRRQHFPQNHGSLRDEVGVARGEMEDLSGGVGNFEHPVNDLHVLMEA
jgi:hypothetical protein